MTTHHAPFESPKHLAADIARSIWLIYIVAGAETIRPWLARTLTHWGARLDY